MNRGKPGSEKRGAAAGEVQPSAGRTGNGHRPSAGGAVAARLASWMVIFLLLLSCSAADLRDSRLPTEGERESAEREARRIFARVLDRMGATGDNSGSARLAVEGMDIWYSTPLRWLTPLASNRQSFDAIIGPGSRDVLYRFRNGPSETRRIGTDDRGTFVDDGSGRRYGDDGTVRLYVLPLRWYLEWPASLAKSPILAYAGPFEKNGTVYDVIFAASDTAADLSTSDHYRIYVRRDTALVDYIEFTMRDLAAFYRGALHYDDYREVSGRLLPFRIGVGDSVDDADFVHEFRYESIRLLESSPQGRD